MENYTDMDTFEDYFARKAFVSGDFNTLMRNCEDEDIYMMLYHMGTGFDLVTESRREEIVYWYLLRIMRDYADHSDPFYYETAFRILDTVIPEATHWGCAFCA